MTFSDFSIYILNIITNIGFYLAFFLQGTDYTFEDFHPLIIFVHNWCQSEHSLEDSSHETTVTMSKTDKFFIVFLEKELSVNLNIIFISILIFFSSFFKKTKTAIKFVWLNDVYEFFYSIIVIIDIAYKLVINSFLILIFT